MRSKRVFLSTLTNSASQLFINSSFPVIVASLSASASTCFLQYSITLARILLVTLGNGMSFSAQSSSIICLMVCDSTATASSTTNVSPSEDFSVIFFDSDILGKNLEREKNPKLSFFKREMKSENEDWGWKGMVLFYRSILGVKWCLF